MGRSTSYNINSRSPGRSKDIRVELETLDEDTQPFGMFEVDYLNEAQETGWDEGMGDNEPAAPIIQSSKREMRRARSVDRPKDRVASEEEVIESVWSEKDVQVWRPNNAQGICDRRRLLSRKIQPEVVRWETPWQLVVGWQRYRACLCNRHQIWNSKMVRAKLLLQPYQEAKDTTSSRVSWTKLLSLITKSTALIVLPKYHMFVRPNHL